MHELGTTSTLAGLNPATLDPPDVVQRGCRVGVFTARFDPATATFDDRALRAALDGAEVWELHTHMLGSGGPDPVWAALAVYRPGLPGGAPGTASPEPGHPAPAPAAASSPAPGPAPDLDVETEPPVARRAPSAPRVDWRATLEGPALARYDALHAWRKRRAVIEQRPSYSVLTNRCMCELALRLPVDERELLQVRGIGPAKVSTYGEALLATLLEATQGTP